MTALPLALSLSSSFTQVGALAAFAALVGIAVMSLLFFSQARELKRLREWADAEPERAAEREQRLSAAVALRIQRATAPLARPVARAAVAAAPATRVAKEAPALALLPAAPAIVGTGKATPEAAEALQSEAPVVALAPADTQAEQSPSEQVPAVAAVAAGATAVAAGAVEGPPRSPAPPPPPPVAPAAPPVRRSEPERAAVVDREAVPVAAGRGAAPEAPPTDARETGGRERTAAGGRERASVGARGGGDARSQGGRRVTRRARTGPPPGPPFLREQPRRGSRLPLLLVGAAVVAIVVVLVVVLGSGGSSPSTSRGTNANLTSSTTSQARHTSSTATQSSEASAPATNPAETRVVVLNATETAGLAHRLSGNLQQGGYALAEALAGTPAARSTSVVQYTAGHRTDAEHVAQTLEISQVQPLEASVATLASGATVVVIAGQDKSSAP